jgi:hypothetical protein
LYSALHGIPLCVALRFCICIDNNNTNAVQVAGEGFGRHYGSFMPGIKAILGSTAGNAELALLRGKAMECAGLVGEAVR